MRGIEDILLKDYIDIAYEVTQDGLSIQKGKLKSFSAAPHCDGKTTLNIAVPGVGRIYLKLTYMLKKEIPLMEKKQVLGFDELKLDNQDSRNTMVAKLLEKEQKGSGIQLDENDNEFTVTGNDFTYVVSKKTGLFEQIKFGGREYLNKPMELNIWRAPTDNDMYIKAEWKKAHYDEAYTHAYKVEALQNKYGIIVMSHVSVVAATVQKILDVQITWKICDDGRISSTMEAVKDSEFPVLPRFGIRLFLDSRLDDTAYFGMGPKESYRDKNKSSYHGLFRAHVNDLHEDYIRPQENSSHYGCRYLTVSSEDTSVMFTAGEEFSFNASQFSQEELAAKAHNYELERCESNVICVDYAMAGVGSNSCGPRLAEKYQLEKPLINAHFHIQISKT